MSDRRERLRPITSRITLAIKLSVAVIGFMVSFATFSNEAIRIAFIDPLSGPFANTGELALKHFQAAVAREDILRRMGGRRIEIVAYDNKGSVQGTASMFQRVVDQGIRFVVQGQGSAAALTLLHMIEMHNARNPDRTVLFLNYAALDPDLTNAKCSFWHFRFDATIDTRLRALLSTVLSDDKNREAFYLLNQDYSFGHHVSRVAREMINRPGAMSTIVGDDLHPIGGVKDFSPYILKAMRARASVIITGNWGVDLALLIKAAREMGYAGRFLTFYAGTPGAVTAIGHTEAGRIMQVNEWHPNATFDGARPYVDVAADFTKKFGREFYFPRIFTLVDFLASAFQANPSGQPQDIAYALENMRLSTPTGIATVRRQDHQLIQALYVSTLVPSARKGGPKDVLHDTEGTGMGFQTVRRIESNEGAPQTTCLMARPARRPSMH